MGSLLCLCGVQRGTEYKYEYQCRLSHFRCGLILCNCASRTEYNVLQVYFSLNREPALQNLYLGTEDELHVPQHALGARIRDRRIPLESLTSHVSPRMRSTEYCARCSALGYSPNSTLLGQGYSEDFGPPYHMSEHLCHMPICLPACKIFFDSWGFFLMLGNFV